MDPNMTLRMIREARHRIETRGNNPVANAEDREHLLALYQALDDWITGGGFLPVGWAPAPAEIARMLHGEREHAPW